MVVMEGWECPTVCKKEEGIVREGEMSGITCPGNMSGRNVRIPK